MLIAARARTSLAILGAAGTVVGALLLSQPASQSSLASDSYGDDGVKVMAKLATAKILPGAMEHDVAVSILVPYHGVTRAPLSLVVAIDRSGSMGGKPLVDAKRAAHQLVEQLAPGDAFSIVTYSSADETVAPISLATAEAKARAHSAIDLIEDEGGTCISCGLDRSTRELAASPLDGGLRRVVLISDGQANEGIWDRDELAEHAAALALGNVSITSVGVGLDFDEVTMVRLANVARGNYYVVEDTEQLGAMFTRELGTLTETVGVNAVLTVSDTADARVVGIYGYPGQRAGDQLRIPVADLHPGMTKVVLRMALGKHALGAFSPAKVELTWQRPDSGLARHAGTTAVADIVADKVEVDESVDYTSAHLIELARTARALDEAGAVLGTHGVDAAVQVLERRTGEINGSPYLLSSDALQLRNVDESHAQLVRTAPEQARKQLAASAYMLAR
jgi:Ca-activated chloride channel family protein